MSAPKHSDWNLLKRVGRYLIGKPRLVQEFKWQELPMTVDCYTDSDWAGDRKGRKSTSGGVLMFGFHTIKTWSSTQQVIALSSGEAELYALVKGAAQSKGICSMLKDFGVQANAQ
eukprot:9856951-Karenia_brevis.AAC.1